MRTVCEAAAKSRSTFQLWILSATAELVPWGLGGAGGYGGAPPLPEAAGKTFCVWTDECFSGVFTAC
jgi:hypothetical protein